MSNSKPLHLGHVYAAANTSACPQIINPSRTRYGSFRRSPNAVAGISGAKGRDKRPGLDAMLKDASRRKFDVVMAWAIDRLGRSLIDLLGTIQHLDAVGVDLYLDQQNIDTTTPAGKLLFQKIARDGKFVSKAGKVRRKLGRPGAEPDKIETGSPRASEGARHRQGGSRGWPRRRHRPSPEA
jgi:hypothetical protein